MKRLWHGSDDIPDRRGDILVINNDGSFCVGTEIWKPNRHTAAWAYIAELADEAKTCITPGFGYVALVDDDVEDDEEFGLRWYITTKEYWEKTGYINDQHLGIDIPDFSEVMESCFEYEGDVGDDAYESVKAVLIKMGFEIVEFEN